MHVCTCSCMCMVFVKSGHKCAQNPEVSGVVLRLSWELSTMFSETLSLIGQIDICPLGQAGLSVRPRSLFISASPVLGLQLCNMPNIF